MVNRGSFAICTLDSVADFRNGKSLSPSKYSPDGQYPVYGSNGQIARTNELLNASPVVVIGRVGAFCGSVYFVKEPSWVTDNAIVATAKPGIDVHFLYFLLKSLGLNQTAIGSAQPLMTQGGLKVVTTKIPPLSEQRAIAHILGTLDDKIELNRRMNQTLEAMAQALFKSWFVDFEPFRDQGMQDSPLGEIPMGWEIGTLGQICEVKMGQSPPGDTYNEIGEGIPFYQGIKDFGSRFPHHRVYCTMPTRFAEPYDVLLSVRAPVGRLNVANERCAIGRGLAALCSKVRHHSYLYYLLNNAKNRWETFNSEGTVFGCITRKDIMDVTVIIPPKTIVDRFESLVNTSDNLIALNEQESFTLSTIRDTLLPKLLSGEIRVKDAERFVEKAL